MTACNRKRMALNRDRLPSNGLAFSCRERVTTSVSKSQRSRARSGQLQPPMRQSARQYSRNCHHSGRSMAVPEQCRVGLQREFSAASWCATNILSPSGLPDKWVCLPHLLASTLPVGAGSWPHMANTNRCCRSVTTPQRLQATYESPPEMGVG
jgi:hypothetical protein